jgi:hypothetical protein
VFTATRDHHVTGERARTAGIGGVLISAVLLAVLAPPTSALTNEALLDTLQHTAFDYFWNEANPTNGLVKDRSTSTSPCSIASTGFGLSAICIAVDHGWLTRSAARARVLTTLETFWNGPQGYQTTGTIGYKGLFYHFLDMNTAVRTWTSELSTIDTALLFAGILDAKEYFTQDETSENQIRALADSIYYRADWEFMRNLGVGIRMGWTPENGFAPFGTWIGYNEAMILYILALGSPTHPVPESTWNTWTSGYSWQTQYGYSYVVFAPLFGHQYSHAWIDFRNIYDAYMLDKGIDYFENSRRATLAQRAYCIANPFALTGYGADVWGITAGDDPFVGYQARGAPPPMNDNGTISPTAVGGSIAFAPTEAISALQNFYNSYHTNLWSVYGFKDAFNLGQNWWDTDYLGIDQGPIILMIENYRTEGVWNRMMANTDVRRGLHRAGFNVSVGIADGGDRPPFMLLQNAPNPFRTASTITYRLGSRAPVRLVLYDAAGRRVRTLFDGYQDPGDHQVRLSGEGLPGGVYFYRLDAEGITSARKAILIR